MSTRSVGAHQQSAILKGTKSVAVPQQVQISFNALEVQSTMGISLETLACAIKATSKELGETPRGQKWQTGLSLMVEIWTNLVTVCGNEEDARLFLKKPRPELRDQTAISYFDQGRPAVVLNLLCSIREMLP